MGLTIWHIRSIGHSLLYVTSLWDTRSRLDIDSLCPAAEIGFPGIPDSTHILSNKENLPEDIKSLGTPGRSYISYSTGTQKNKMTPLYHWYW